MFQLVLREERGILSPQTHEREMAVYLDLTGSESIPAWRPFEAELSLYAKFTGENPRTNPLCVFPAVHASLGGLWVDHEADAHGQIIPDSPRNHATSIPGLYAAGDVDYQYHGARRLDGNALLAAVYAGGIAGQAIDSYCRAHGRSVKDLPGSIFERAEATERSRFERLLAASDGDATEENPYTLYAELGKVMFEHCTVERDDRQLAEVIGKLDELGERARTTKPNDRGLYFNQGARFARQLGDMIVLARVIAASAKLRDECRGVHHKPACDPKQGGPGRDDERWLRTTLAASGDDGDVRFVRQFEYECAGTKVAVTDAVDTRHRSPTHSQTPSTPTNAIGS